MEGGAHGVLLETATVPPLPKPIAAESRPPPVRPGADAAAVPGTGPVPVAEPRAVPGALTELRPSQLPAWSVIVAGGRGLVAGSDPTTGLPSGGSDAVGGF